MNLNFKTRFCFMEINYDQYKHFLMTLYYTRIQNTEGFVSMDLKNVHLTKIIF